MYIKLINANFSVNNIGKLNSYSISITGASSNAYTATNIPGSVEIPSTGNPTVSGTITINTGYTLSSVVTTMSGSTVSVGSTYTVDIESGTITFNNFVLTGDLNIALSVTVSSTGGGGGSEGGGGNGNPLITWTINGVNIANGELNTNTNRLASNIFSPADVKTIVANGDFEFLLYAYSTSTPSSIIGRLNTEGAFTDSTVGTGQWLSSINMSDYSSSQYYRLVCRYKSAPNTTFTSVISNCAIINGSLPEDDTPTGSYTPNWINGKGIDLATGTIVVANTARQTTQNMFTPGQVSTITANGDFEFLLYAYSTSSESSIIGRLNTEGNFTESAVGTGQWLTSFTMSNYPNQYYRLVCRYKSDTSKVFTSVVSDCATFA